jgi:DNA polymerase alpha-associated DNA helicase A
MGDHMKLSGTSSHSLQHDGLDADSASDNRLDSSNTGYGIEHDAQGSMSKTASNLRSWLVPPPTLEVTMFERLEQMFGLGIKCMLTVQYRCVVRLRTGGLLSNPVDC